MRGLSDNQEPLEVYLSTITVIEEESVCSINKQKGMNDKLQRGKLDSIFFNLGSPLVIVRRNQGEKKG